MLKIRIYHRSPLGGDGGCGVLGSYLIGEVGSWRIRGALALSVILFGGAEYRARGQGVPQPPTFRISVDRIQVSAVVTDSKGRQVTDLRMGDFTLSDAGKPQQLTNCEYVPLVAPESGAPAVSRPPSSGVGPRLKGSESGPEQVRRSIVFLVDDESFSTDAILAVRKAVSTAIERNLQPGDLAAVIRTSSGNGSLEQFTADKGLLLEAVGKIRWRPESRGNPGMLMRAEGTIGDKSSGRGQRMSNYLVQESQRRSMSVLEFVISALRDLPGRKAVFLMSQSFLISPVYTYPGRSSATDVGAMVDKALRAGVVIYCADPTPLSSLTPGADYNPLSDYLAQQGTAGWGSPRVGPGSMTNAEVGSTLRNYTARAFFLLEAYRSGLRVLAEGTGGQMAADTDTGAALERYVNDLQGYYLLTYKPSRAEQYFAPTAADHPPFRKVKIHVARPGMHVRSYAGYVATPGPAEPETSAYGEISKALFSPFSSAGVRVALTSIFAQPQPSSPQLALILHVDARDLTFTAPGNGRHDAAFDLVVRVSGEGSEPARVVSKQVILRLEETAFAETMQAGVSYRLPIPAPHAGVSEVHVAVRDTASGALGSAREFVEVPDLRNGRVALSGVLVSNASQRGPNPDAPGLPELRRFRREDSLRYACQVFNAKSITGEARVTLTGTPVLTVAAEVVANGDGTSTLRGVMPLSTLAPGYYLLNVQASAQGDQGKSTAASQWTDFEIVP